MPRVAPRARSRSSSRRPAKLPATEQDADAALAEALTRLPVGRAASEVAKALGLDRKALYARALAMKGGDASD